MATRTERFERTGLHAAVAGIAAMVLFVTGCSSGGSSAKASPGGADRTDAPTTTVARPAGPAATFSELDGGNGVLLLAPNPGPKLSEVGYTETEYEASGTATAYALSGGGDTFPANGEMTLEPTTDADYATRIVVRRPSDAADFNGTVVLEWNNVSGGLDVAPDWTYTGEEIVRSGYAWVGVSAQRIGIEGGTVAVETPVSSMGGAGKGIKAQDPERYGDLHHPGDAYAYDIFTQVARGLRSPTGGVDPLGDLDPERLLAMGESQSAYALTTYYDGVQPLTHAFDGFLVHSRGGAALALGKSGEGTDISSAVTSSDPVRFRTDQDVPVIVVASETDIRGVLAYEKALQPDNDHLRIWQLAGTSHVDVFQLGPVAERFGCSVPVNAGPMVFMMRAALAALDTWVVEGVTPPKSAALELSGDDEGDYVRDEHGIAVGGIRTPQVDVPVDVLSGIPAPQGSVACLLAGTTTPIPDEELAEMYEGADDYTARYAEATDSAIEAGFVLEADRDEMLADAHPERIPG